MSSLVARRAEEVFRALTPERLALRAMESDVLRTQVAVTRIPAPTGEEGARALWISERLRASGLAPSRDTAGNVLARIAGRSDDDPVVVCAHLDTVFTATGDVDVVADGPRVSAPGISDNGRGLATMLAVASAMQRGTQSLVRPVEFVATTGEEGTGNLRGARQYFETARRPFAVVAIDGAGDERIINGALGSRRFRVTFRGPGGHSWGAYGTPNAVHAAGHATATLATLRLPRAGNTTLTVSRIGGGQSINSIPESAWLEIDVRSMSAASLARVEREVQDVIVAAVQRENDRRQRTALPLVAEIIQVGDRPAGVTGEDTPLVQAAWEATRLVGRTPDLAAGSTDANAAVGDGVPAIAIGGGGRGGDTHTSREWFDSTGASIGLERALTLVATLAAL